MLRLLTTILFVAVTWTPAARAQEMVRVPAGPFTMGSTSGDADERPPHTINLQAFQIDRFEVTVASYARCVKAGACKIPRRYPRPAKASAGSRGSLPVAGVSWSDARDYCRWVGKELPTEAQWERAARGTDGRVYPWGDRADCARANFGNFAGAGLCAPSNPGHPLPVGSRKRGVSPAGAHDMAGNVWEWVADDYRPYTPGKEPAPARSGMCREALKVVRGGSCCSYFIMPRASNRVAYPATLVDRDIGFRCARSSTGAPKGGGVRP